MSPLPLQVRAVALSLVPVLAIGLILQLMQSGKTQEAPTVAIEHARPATVALRISMQRTVRLIDVSSEAGETIFVNVPQEWRRSEVRGAPLSEVTADAPSLGFARWKLPARAGVTFRADGLWRTVSVQNPSGVPLEVRVTRVDLETNAATHDRVLVKDETIVVGGN